MEELYSIPLGYRFLPTDDELIEHYLMKKINGEKLPKINDFQEICINSSHPQEYCTTENKHKRGENWYFFTRREKKYKKGGRPNRQVGGKKGFWKATGNDVEIMKDGQIIGYRKTLDYQEEKGIRSKWKMHEFRIHKKGLSHELDKSVLCEIYINKRTNNNDEDIIQATSDNINEVININNDIFNNIIQAPSYNIDEVSYNNNVIQATSYNMDEVKYFNGYENIIYHDDPIPENINMRIHEENLEHGQNFIGTNDCLEFYNDHQFVQKINTPNLISSSSNHIDNNIYHYKGFDELGVVVQKYVQNGCAKNNIIQATNDNIDEVKNVDDNDNIIQATSNNIDEVKNVSGNDNNVYDFKGFDELSVVVQRYVQMKK
ncbi:NAC domain-containing protein 1-like [Solanum lycopersicum]|uniref:NAC domain-containing protein 1-like n=1 Tax=Solanum lycopersicum TaxID=4081 RepID=UPI000E1D85EE|nr:NAC domain-containing protein 19-like [Solanum lycopersicum]XP_025886243.1 NAC domain-containing protein 19-like [Solanum lycopersicum]